MITDPGPDPGGQARRPGGDGRGGAARFPVALPGLCRHRRARRHAGQGLRPAGRRRPRLSRLHRRGPVRRVPAGPAPGPAGRRGVRQPALPESAVAGYGRPGGGDPGADPGVLPGLPAGVRGHLHPERHRRAAAGRRVLSLRAGQPVPADLRQPQLGQRDPAVRPGPRRLGQLHPSHHRRPARIRGGAGPPSPGRAPARAVSPVGAPAPPPAACSPSRPSPTSPASSTR